VEWGNTKKGALEGSKGVKREYTYALAKVYSWFSRARDLLRYIFFFLD
jgi:hypothetical protein